MLVKDVMSSSIISVSPEDTLETVCILMKSEDVGVIPVCDKQNHILGVITDRDIVLKLAENPKNISVVAAQNIMSSSPVTVNSGDDIHDAALKFSAHKIRRLPVLDGERLVGLLSLKDLAKKRVLTAEIGHIVYNICN